MSDSCARAPGCWGFMRLAYTTIYDATSTANGFSSYNGVGYHMAKALLRAGLDLDYLGPLRETYAPILIAKQLFARRVLKKVYNRHRERLACRDYSRQIDRKLGRRDYELVFSGLSVGSQPVAYLRSTLPIVIWTDSTLASAVNFYPDFTAGRMVWSNLQQGLDNEREAMSRASMLIFSSEWARREAIAQYQLDPQKVKLVPLGANEENAPPREIIQDLIESRPLDVCRLLFVGMDWHRKGGEIALRVAESLHRRGVRVELTLVGSSPADGKNLPPYVRALGLITRRDAQGARRLDELFARSHFLVFPSRADSFGQVLVEANSFGVPCASSDVGGIASVVANDRNGRTFSRDAEPSQYADWIADVFASPERYRRLALSSFGEYESRLNWTTSGQKVAGLLDNLLHPPHRTIPLPGRDDPRRPTPVSRVA